MNRAEFLAFAQSRGWIPGRPLSGAQKDALRLALRNRLTQGEVAPARVFDNGTSRPMTADDAAQALVEELE